MVHKAEGPLPCTQDDTESDSLEEGRECVRGEGGRKGKMERGREREREGNKEKGQSRGRRSRLKRREGGRGSSPLHFRQFLPNLIFLLHYTRDQKSKFTGHTCTFNDCTHYIIHYHSYDRSLTT